MRYTITQTVEVVPYGIAVANAPADLIKLAKDMAERGEIANFGKVIEQEGPSAMQFTWAILTVDITGKLKVAKRHTEFSITNS